MKILAINCNPDLTYFTKRGLNFDITYENTTEKFPLELCFSKLDSNGNKVDIYTPKVLDYLEKNYALKDYAFIILGWKSYDYGYQLNNTGGYTGTIPLSNGTQYCTVRQDIITDNIYVIHEIHHILCRILWSKGIYPGDFMDIDKKGRSYYLNNQPENPESNHAQTWNELKKYLLKLQEYTLTKTVTLKRDLDTGKETLGTLTCGDFICNTLERPWKNNLSNISCIPTGKYLVEKSFSPKLLKTTYEIKNVPRRSGIRFHSSSFWTDLKGCIALGSGYANLNNDKEKDLINSRITIKKFEDYMKNNSFFLVIK